MNCPVCQDSGIITLYQNGIGIRRPCPCLTRGRTLDRIQLMQGRPSQPPVKRTQWLLRTDSPLETVTRFSLSVDRCDPIPSWPVGYLSSQRPTYGLNLF